MHSAFVKKETDFFLLDNEDVKIAVYFIGASRKKKYDDAKEEELGKLRKAAGIADSEGKLIAGKDIEFLDDDKKTLVIRFDSFEINEEEWAKYYSGNPSAMPDPASTGFPTDCMGLFYKAFYYIQRDKKNESGDYANVKTVLIDDC